MEIGEYKRSRLVKLLRWITPKINRTAWQMWSEDSLKLDDCLAGCQCGRQHCDESCPDGCRRHCNEERTDLRRWLQDFLYVRKFEPPCVRAVNWKKNWVLDRQGVLRGPYTYQAWLRYGFWCLDAFHETGEPGKFMYWHQLYFRDENQYYGGSYNHFYPIQFLMIHKLEGLEDKHLASNNVTRGFDVYHNIMPIDRKDAVKVRNAGKVFTVPEPHEENLRSFHGIRKRPLEAELREYEKQDKKAKTDYVKKNAKRVRNWCPEPEGQNLTREEAKKEADKRFDHWYPKNRNVPVFIPRNSNRVIPPAFPTKPELEQKYYKFNMKTLEAWLTSKAIYKLDKNENPDMIVPAVYANMEKKGRMCVDGGWIKAIEAYSLKCHLEDLPKAMMVLTKNAFMTKCDDRRGFHLLKIGKEGRKLTAFKLFDEVWAYRVAAFGIPGSPGVFQLANQVAVNYGRCYGIEWQVYLDDRLMLDYEDTVIQKFGCKQPQNCIRGMALINGNGGFVSLDKSALVPERQIQFLGMDLNTETGTISVPLEKWEKYVVLIRNGS